MGAFEAGGVETCFGDIDDDGDVGISDLLLILAQWGKCPPKCLGDANRDGFVDIADLLIVLSLWGPCSECPE